MNLLLATDGYKASHAFQYPAGTQYVYSYIESRGGEWDKLCYFGFQMFRDAVLNRPITHEMIDEAVEINALYGMPFFEAGWRDIVDRLDGKLPVEIRALDEGMVVPVGTPLLTIVNTDPKCFFVTSFLETALLRAIWYPTTVATNSWICRQMIMSALEKTSDDPAGQIPFKLHDFGARGVSSAESAGIGGLAHLVNFAGTDTMEAIVMGRRYYHEAMPGFSIPAAEHSTITGFGREHEVDAYRNMIRVFGKPGALISIVSDSYDIYNAVDNIFGVELRQEILDSGATIVIRPDSGDPTIVPIEVLKLLDKRFGSTINAKGYRVLNPAVKVIQGDGITHQSLQVLLDNVVDAGYSIDNIAFGMGGGLLQMVNRDTLKFAMKCSAMKVDGKWRDVFKDPVGDHSKKSKRGRMSVVMRDDELQVVHFGAVGDLLKLRYRDGEPFSYTTLAQVRERANP